MKNKILIILILIVSILTFQVTPLINLRGFTNFDIFMIGYSFCFFLCSLYIFINSCPKIIFWTGLLLFGTINNFVDELTHTAEIENWHEYAVFILILIMSYKKMKK